MNADALQEINMMWITAKFLPCLLIQEQRQWQLSVCREKEQEQVKNNLNFLFKVIIGDRNWFHS